MSQFSSFGLLELLILAGGAGLLLAVGAIVVAVILNKRRQNRAPLDGVGAERDAGERTAAPPREPQARGRRRRVGLLVGIIVAALLAPLVAVVLGVLWVIPVRQVREPVAPSHEMVVISADGTPTVTVEQPTPGAVPTAAPPAGQPSSGGGRRDFLDPDNTLSWAIVLPSIAGLVLLIGTAGLVLMATSWSRADPRPEGAMTRTGTDKKRARTRNVLLVLFSWFALSAFLVLDLLFAISLSYRFVALYAAFWALVGALLLHDRPLRVKLVVLALLVLVLFSVRFVDWTSRKPFLKDLYRVQEGMTPAQVDRIMGGYIREVGSGPPGSEDQAVYDERGAIVEGWVTYRHTDKGWGDADWGMVAFENGHVAETRFLPD